MEKRMRVSLFSSEKSGSMIIENSQKIFSFSRWIFSSKKIQWKNQGKFVDKVNQVEIYRKITQGERKIWSYLSDFFFQIV